MTTNVTSATQIHPTEDRVLIRPDEQPDVSAGGIILPDTAKERPQEGEVVAAGPGKRSDNGKRLEMELKVGDRVVYSKYAGTEVSVDGKEFLIMAAGDVLSKFS